MKKKLLFLHHGTGIGGAFISLFNLINALDRNKYDITVLFLKDSNACSFFLEKGIQAEFIQHSFYNKFYRYYANFETSPVKWYHPHIYFRVFISWVLSALIFAPKILRKFDYDLLYLNSSVLTDWAYASRKFERKTILHLRETFTKGYFGIRRLLVRKIIEKKTNFVISISKYNARALGLREKYQVIYNYADERFFHEAKSIQNNQPLKILYVGGYSYIKGFITMVASLKFLREPYILYFAGNYPEARVDNTIKRKIKYLFFPYNKMKTSLKELKIITQHNENIKLVGLQSDILKLFKDIDILVSPFSKSHFSRPVIEAFALKKIVVSSDIPGIEEIIHNGNNGFLFKKEDPSDLAQVINLINLLSLKKKKEISNNAYLEAINKYSSKNIIQIENIINKVINEK